MHPAFSTFRTVTPQSHNNYAIQNTLPTQVSTLRRTEGPLQPPVSPFSRPDGRELCRQHHLVQISFLRMHPFRPHGAHHLAETHHRHAAHSRRITALQNGENDRGRIEFELLSRLRQTKTTVEHLLLYGHGIELAVAQLQFRFLFGRKPITLAALQLRLQLGSHFQLRRQLGKQLLVLQWRAVYFLFHLGTKITATARGVGQQILMITGSYKRSHAGQVTVG